MRLTYPIFVSALMICFFAFSAIAEEWVSVTDEIDVDYNRSIVRIYSVIKQLPKKSSRKSIESKRRGKDRARDILSSYIATLTTGSDKKNIEEELKGRPALSAKVQYVVEENLHNVGALDLPASEQYGYYFTFDLKLLKALIPELNMPQPAGTVQ